jgi:SAM-dependent methyltransferase
MSSAEALQHREHLAESLRRDFGLALHPLQTDPSFAPPPAVVGEIQGSNTADADTFFGASHRDMALYLEIFRSHGLDITRMERVLDFGVGTGRMLAQFLPFRLALHGVDVNPAAVEWTRRKLEGLATIALSQFQPPLGFESGFFDLVLANSVFTHMPYAAQPGWIAELARVLKPGGCALITVHDFSKLPPERAREGWYERGKARGLHLNTYLSEARLAALWQPAFELLEIRRFPPRQAFVVARRRF